MGVIPAIVLQPISASVLSGSDVVLSIEAIGTAPLLYQWYKNGSVISGADERVLSIASASLTNAGSFSVLVSNLFGSVLSEPATVSATTPPPVYRLHLVSWHPVDGVSLSANVPTGVLFALESSGDLVVWSEKERALSIGGPMALQDRELSVSRSRSYRLRSLVNTDAPRIIRSPEDVVAIRSQTIRLSVEAAGGGTLKYQWLRNGVPIAGQTGTTLSIVASSTAVQGIYSVQVTNEFGSATSAGAVVSLNSEGTGGTRPPDDRN